MIELQIFLNIRTLSPSAISAITASVDGFIVENFFPLTASTNSLLMNS